MHSLLKDNFPIGWLWPQLAVFTRQRMASELTHGVAMSALIRLNEKLKDRNQTLHLVLIGGGAMLLVYKGRTSTKDLDAIPYPLNNAHIDLLEECRDEVTVEMATEGVNLPEDWVNAQAGPIFQEQAKYLKAGDLRPVASLDFSFLKIYVASPEALLSMKIQALREDSKDYMDVLLLCKMLHIKSYEQMMQIVEPRMEDIGIIGNTDELRLKAIIQKANGQS